MYQLVRKHLRRIEEDLSGKKNFFKIRPTTYSLFKKTAFIIPKVVKGQILDLGAGMLVYKNILREYCNKYISIDVKPLHRDLNMIGDAHKLPIKAEVFDVVFCRQLLQYTKEPWVVIEEIKRVLKRGGVAILTVPHISDINNPPFDRYRYTKYGIEYLVKRGGLEVLSIEAASGLISLFGNIFSILLLTLFYKIPFISNLISAINQMWIKLVLFVDELVDKEKIFAINYLVIVKKVKNDKK